MTILSKIINRRSLLVLSLGLLQVAAYAQFRRPIPRPHRPGPGPIGGTETVTAYVNQSYRGQNYISLKQLLWNRLNRRQELKSVLSVSVTVSSRRGRGQVGIEGRGRSLSPAQIAPTYLSTLNFNLRRRAGSLQVNDIELATRGAITISSVSVRLEGRGGHNPGPGNDIIVDDYVNQMVDGREILRLGRSLRLNQYRGEMLKAIFIEASARRHGNAQLLINGMRVGAMKSIGSYGGRIRFPVRRVIGHDVRSVQLEVNGRRVMIDRVGAKISDGDFRRRPHVLSIH